MQMRWDKSQPLAVAWLREYALATGSMPLSYGKQAKVLAGDRGGVALLRRTCDRPHFTAFWSFLAFEYFAFNQKLVQVYQTLKILVRKKNTKKY